MRGTRTVIRDGPATCDARGRRSVTVTVGALAFALAGRRDGPENTPARIAQAESALSACSAAGWHVLLGDALPTMPAALRPPRVLFVRGAIEAVCGSRPSVAVVGSRVAPVEARRWAHACARALVSRGARVVSGLAHGIDAAAHRAALDAGGLTVAVVAHGLDTVYPAAHAALAEAIVAAGGAVVSEYPPGTPPDGWRFAARDRVQVGLSRAVIAVHSEPDGGTMHTVAHATRAGVPVLVPDAPREQIGAGLADALRDGRARAVPDVEAAVRGALEGGSSLGALFARRG
jgi:DNA protecting protein DprA